MLNPFSYVTFSHPPVAAYAHGSVDESKQNLAALPGIGMSGESDIIVHARSDGSKFAISEDVKRGSTLINMDSVGPVENGNMQRFSVQFARRLDSFSSTDELVGGEGDLLPQGDPTQKCTYVNNLRTCPSPQSGSGGPFCHRHTCPKCGKEKRMKNKLCTFNKDKKPDCPSLHTDENEDGWKHSKWRLLFKRYFSPAYAVTTAIVYYADFGTDVSFLVEIDTCSANSFLPRFFFYVRLGHNYCYTI